MVNSLATTTKKFNGENLCLKKGIKKALEGGF